MRTDLTEDTTATMPERRQRDDRSAAESPDLSLLDVLLIVLQHRRMIATVTAAVAVVTAAIVFLIPDRYTATTTLMPPQQPQSMGAALAAQFGGATGVLGAMAAKDLGLKNPNEIYVAILKSRVIADDLIQRFKLKEEYGKKTDVDTRKRFEEATYISGAREGLLSVSVEDTDRQRSAAIANAYVDELRKLMSRLAVTEAAQRRLFFEQQLVKTKDSLANAESELKMTQQNTGLIQLDAQAKSVIESLSAVKAQVAAKEVELQAAHSFATDQNPQIVLLHEQLAGLRAQVKKLETRQNAGAGDIQISSKSVPQVGLEYVRRLRELKYQETMFELLTKQFEASKLDEAREGAIIQVVDIAVPPDKKSFPPRGLIVVGVSILALFIASGCALASERLANVSRPRTGSTST